jgi:predicted O-methyltransferase YrrM
MNQLLKNIYRTRTLSAPDGSIINPFPTSIPYHQGRTLYNLVRATRATRTLEIGMAYGLSSVFICQALHDNGAGQHTALDPFERTAWKSVGLHQLKQAGLEKYFNFYEDYSYNLLPQFLDEGRAFDFIFIDSSHRFAETVLEYFYSDRLLTVNGYFMLDDVRMPAVRKVLAFIVRNTSYRVSTRFVTPASLLRRPLLWIGQQLRQGKLFGMANLFLGKSRRYCILQKISNDTSPWDYFRDF